MLNFYNEMKTSSCKQAPASKSKEINNMPLTINWLGGFTDGDSTFSILKYKPRIKFENHIKELNLFERIKDFNDWSIILDIYYYGYHLIPEGQTLITEIKNQWNNFRLSTSFVSKKKQFN